MVLPRGSRDGPEHLNDVIRKWLALSVEYIDAIGP